MCCRTMRHSAEVELMKDLVTGNEPLQTQDLLPAGKRDHVVCDYPLLSFACRPHISTEQRQAAQQERTPGELVQRARDFP